jgi:DNA-binding NtrC family response regulator
MKHTTLLIVDDDPAVRKSLVRYLDDKGYDLVAAESYEQAIALLGDHHPQLAIVDMRLAGNSGENVILAAHALQPTLRFLVYTGSNTFEVTPAMDNVGIKQEDIIHKPVESLSVIQDAIERILAQDKNGGES